LPIFAENSTQLLPLKHGKSPVDHVLFDYPARFDRPAAKDFKYRRRIGLTNFRATLDGFSNKGRPTLFLSAKINLFIFYPLENTSAFSHSPENMNLSPRLYASGLLPACPSPSMTLVSSLNPP
jgi:hypothetical protein